MRNGPKSKLLRPKKDSQFWQDVVAADIFVHDATVIVDVRDALEQGLKPVTFSLIGDSVILRLERSESRKPLQEE